MSFTDDAGNQETLAGTATDAVAAAQPTEWLAAPTGLSATATHDQVVLYWDNPQDDTITGYVILRRNRDTDAEGQFTSLVNDTGNADTTYTDGTVSAETPYTYRIQAINAAGVSERSRWFHIDIPAAPAPEMTPEPANSAATGAPIVSGTAQVGGALTADTSGIADADGIDNVSFTYQWLADDTAIQGAVGSSYTLVETDEGKTVKVQVTFTDDAGNAESLTSEATDAVAGATQPNSPATGAPTISGTAQVGEELTASTAGIADEDGLDNAAFTYQWQAEGTDISGATSSTYTLAEADEGKAIKVRVSFTDDEGNDETLTSGATEAVAAAEPTEPPAAPTSLTAVVNNDGTVTLSWDTPDDDSVTGYQILRRRPKMGEDKLLVYVADTGGTATTFTDTDVTEGDRHVYRVKAINAAGLGKWSNYVRVEP